MDYSVLIIDDEIELADSTAEYFNMFGVWNPRQFIQRKMP